MTKEHKPLPTANLEQNGFLTWTDDASRARVFANYDTSKFDGFVTRKVSASYLNTFRNIDANTSVRDGFTKRDYNYFRPNEMVPWMAKDIIRTCMMAYDKVGLVKNVIDMMADFTTQGIEIVHPVPKVQRLCRKWFKMVGGKERSERLANMLYRAGNVIVKRVMAEIPDTELSKLHKIHADIQQRGKQLDIEYPEVSEFAKNQIPIKYIILNPVMVEPIGGDLAPFVGNINYGLIVPNSIISKIRKPQPLEQNLIEQIPQYIRDWVYAGPVAGKILPLPMDRIITMFYKKDDWQLWANPLIYAILDDLIMLEKMKLADLAALDGIISQVRIWKLGNLENKIIPSAAQYAKLSNILMNNIGGGVIDLVWTPDIELQETATNAYKFLGQSKYEPVLNSIYDGLGIPPTMTAAGSAGGFTNNYISLKTLIERLNYGRDLITTFWEKEFEILRQALGIKKPPRLRFNYMSLTDENVEKKILIDLIDRGVLSDETLLERFKEIPGVEKARLMKEQKSRQGQKGKSTRRGPWHTPQYYEDIAKIAVQTGQATPSQVGLELEEKAPGETTMLDQQADLQKESMNMKLQQQKQAKGKPNQGRPGGSTDKSKRKPKSVTPRKSVKASSNFVNLQLWAQSAYKEIAEIINPIMLELFQKENMRQLTIAEAEEVEKVKFGILFNVQPFSNIEPKIVEELLLNKQLYIEPMAFAIYDEMKNQYIQERDSTPPIEDMRMMQTSVYSLLQAAYTEGDINE